MARRLKKNKRLNKNQSSFYFEDYLETTKKNKFSRKIIFFKIEFIYYFFLFISLILIFNIKIIHISLNNIEIHNNKNQKVSLFHFVEIL